MSTRSERAARRSGWTGEIVETGTPKGALYRDLPMGERFDAFVALNRRVWTAAGLWPLPVLDRSEWPGEIVDSRTRD